MTLNDVMAVTLRYLTEVSKPALQKMICGGIYARVYCIFTACTMSSQRKFTFAISSPDEFLVVVVVVVVAAAADDDDMINVTRNSSGDEIANVNFLYDDIVYTPAKIQ